MNRHALLSKERLAVFALVCLAALFIVAWVSPTRSLQDSPFRVENKTKAFEVLRAEVVQDFLKLQLKNVSTTPINGYVLSLGNGGMIQTDYTIGGHEIAPGQVEEQLIPLSEMTVTSAIPQQEVVILAVVFNNRTSDGDSQAATVILNRRQGLKAQLERFLPLLDETLLTPDANLHGALSGLKSHVTSLVEGQGGKLPRATVHGLHDAKEEIQALIDGLQREQQEGGNLRRKLNELRRQIQERIARL
jgi:hypothetical protein